MEKFSPGDRTSRTFFESCAQNTVIR